MAKFDLKKQIRNARTIGAYTELIGVGPELILYLVPACESGNSINFLIKASLPRWPNLRLAPDFTHFSHVLEVNRAINI